MAKIDANAIEKYQSLLTKDPGSQAFAPLAEAYREMGLMKEAMQIVTAGVQRHPQFVGGLVTYAKILRDTQQLPQALDALRRATALAPENILAHQLTAEVQLACKNPKEALKAFKMVLFLNPQSQSAKKAVQKLESLTADEYDEEVFAMAKLPQVNLDASPSPRTDAKLFANAAPSEPHYQPAPPPRNKALERMLSLIDAFIVRNDLEKAHALLKDTRVEFGDSPEIERRMKTLQVRYNDTDEPTPLKPLRSREELIQQKKLETLEMMLRRIEEYRSQG